MAAAALFLLVVAAEMRIGIVPSCMYCIGIVFLLTIGEMYNNNMCMCGNVA